MLMQPPQQHMSLLLSVKAGMLPIKIEGLPTIQGATVLGTQGIGVKTPSAAAVADATVGFARELHIPKGRMLTKGLLSMILAAGVSTSTPFTGNTLSVEGATPKLHVIMAPVVTKNAITHLLIIHKTVNISF
jgi:hypothetical protein